MRGTRARAWNFSSGSAALVSIIIIATTGLSIQVNNVKNMKTTEANQTVW